MTTVADLPATAKMQPQSWQFNYTGDHQEDILQWKVPYADWAVFVQKVLFTSSPISVGGGTINRVFPLVCPLNPNTIALEIQPGSPPQTLQRGQAHSSGPWEETSSGSGIYRPRTSNPPWKTVWPVVRFGVPTYSTSGDQAFIDITKETNTERVTVPGIPYYLEATPGGTMIERVAQDIGLSRGSSVFRVTWHSVPNLPAAEAVLNPLLDKINNASVTIPIIGTVCPAGTLKVSSSTASASKTFGNNVKSTLSVILAYLPGGWNYAVASVVAYAGSLRHINSAAGPPFAAANFDPIFTPTA